VTMAKGLKARDMTKEPGKSAYGAENAEVLTF